MENLTGGNPPVRPLPCVVPCKLYFMQCETKAIELGNICNLSQLNENLQENCIPLSVKNMDASSYEEFLTERRKLMASMMKRYYWSL